MNILKIQTDALKERLAKNTMTCLTTEFEGRVGVSVEGHVVCFILYDDMYLDFHADVPFNVEPFTDQLYKDDYKLSKATIMSPYKPKTGKKINTWKLEVEDSERYAWIDEKYMKYFDKYADFYICDGRSPIWVKEGDNFVGFIMPINRNDM